MYIETIHIHSTCLSRLHGKGGQIVWVLFVPRQPHQGQLLVVLVQNSGVLQVPEREGHTVYVYQLREEIRPKLRAN